MLSLIPARPATTHTTPPQQAMPRDPSGLGAAQGRQQLQFVLVSPVKSKEMEWQQRGMNASVPSRCHLPARSVKVFTC